ncbi:8654_t:CDS:1 [Acaulospora morrowiae]|uniref:8654_t:CDS:1 n=1 Tax=Acaulospora morrowiae TaxID=94023 RepID=A0A9N9A3E3_9GLOM|nr:8654_t:CDS:1 [Acaulospora morrowiae]
MVSNVLYQFLLNTLMEVIKLRKSCLLIQNKQDEQNFDEKRVDDNLANDLSLLELGPEGWDNASLYYQIWESFNLLQPHNNLTSTNTPTAISPSLLPPLSPLEISSDVSSASTTRPSTPPLNYTFIDHQVVPQDNTTQQTLVDDSIETTKKTQPNQKKSSKGSERNKGSKKSKNIKKHNSTKRNKSGSGPKVLVIYPPRKYENVIFNQDEDNYNTTVVGPEKTFNNAGPSLSNNVLDNSSNVPTDTRLNTECNYLTSQMVDFRNNTMPFLNPTFYYGYYGHYDSTIDVAEMNSETFFTTMDFENEISFTNDCVWRN